MAAVKHSCLHSGRCNICTFLAAIRGKLVLRTQTVPLGGGSVQILRRDPHDDMNCLTAAVSCFQQSHCGLRKTDDFEISSQNMRKISNIRLKN